MISKFMFSNSFRKKLFHLNVIVPPKVTQENHINITNTKNKSVLVHSTINKKKENDIIVF